MVNKIASMPSTKSGHKKNGGALLKQKQQPRQQREQQQPQEQQEKEPTRSQPVVTFAEETMEQPMNNPVGALQEHCQKVLWPLPAYTFKCTGGNDPALREFVCTVELLGKRERGVGKSKRLAKRRAAATLLRQLLATTSPSPAEQRHQAAAQLQQQQKPGALPVEESVFQRLCVSKRLQSAGRAGSEIGGLFSGVRNRKAGAPLPALESPADAAVSAFDQLTELGRTHRFGVSFLEDVAADKNNGQQHSIVKLSTMPTIVAIGNGLDAAKSREQACRAAMEYLCLLTKENAANKK